MNFSLTVCEPKTCVHFFCLIWKWILWTTCLSVFYRIFCCWKFSQHMFWFFIYFFKEKTTRKNGLRFWSEEFQILSYCTCWSHILSICSGYIVVHTLQFLYRIGQWCCSNVILIIFDAFCIVLLWYYAKYIVRVLLINTKIGISYGLFLWKKVVVFLN